MARTRGFSRIGILYRLNRERVNRNTNTNTTHLWPRCQISLRFLRLCVDVADRKTRAIAISYTRNDSYPHRVFHHHRRGDNEANDDSLDTHIASSFPLNQCVKRSSQTNAVVLLLHNSKQRTRDEVRIDKIQFILYAACVTPARSVVPRQRFQ